MLFCQNCCSEVPPYARVCPRCGFKLFTPMMPPASNQIQEQPQQKPAPITPKPFHLPSHQPNSMFQGKGRLVSQPGNALSQSLGNPVLQGPITPFPAIPSKPFTANRPKNSFALITPLPSTRLPRSSLFPPAPSTPMQQPPHQSGFKSAHFPEQRSVSKQQAEPEKKLTLTQRYGDGQPTPSVTSATPDTTSGASPRPENRQTVSRKSEPYSPGQQPQSAVALPSVIEIVRKPTTPPRAPAAKATVRSTQLANVAPVLTQPQAMAIQNILRQAAIASTNSVIRARRKPYNKQHADFWILVTVIACIIFLLGLYIVLTYDVPRMSQPSPTMLAAIARTVTRVS